MLDIKGIFTIVSLAVCYRFGPPEDERSLNLMEWTVQIISLVMIYLSNQVIFLLFYQFWIKILG
jgi:hypothetical protein